MINKSINIFIGLGDVKSKINRKLGVVLLKLYSLVRRVMWYYIDVLIFDMI